MLARDSIHLLDFLIRDDLSGSLDDPPPESLLQYVKEIRKLSLRRELSEEHKKEKPLPRHIAVGMIPKKVHEVSHFASYVSDVASSVSSSTGKNITHFVDFGSGQNYLGRTLASPLYNKSIVALESKTININGAKNMDVLAGVAEREKVMRNKKLYRRRLDEKVPVEERSVKAKRRAAKDEERGVIQREEGVDFRPNRELGSIFKEGDGKGYIQYVEHVVQDGDLSNVVKQIEDSSLNAATKQSDSPSILNQDETINNQHQPPETSKPPLNLMAISIHSCGNLSHHGIRSLLLNPTVSAIAIVGCCYNLLTNRLSPPTLKHPLLRPNLRALNAPEIHADTWRKEVDEKDEHGFPMSQRLATYGIDCDGKVKEGDGEGVSLNITARMMAVQAPQNWTAKESHAFFTRHFYRALLQRLFLDYGVVSKTPITSSTSPDVPHSTDPLIIGSLRRACYASFTTYVRGALAKLALDPERNAFVEQKLRDLTDEQIEAYWEKYKEKMGELSVSWCLMAFSAGVVESLIVVDRWLFLKEGLGEKGDAWVESVFDYSLSPRNLVVVGVKK